MNNNHCFIDTSAFIALNYAGDQNYDKAVNIGAKLNGFQFITSDLVISETYTILRYRFGYVYSERFLSTLLDSHEYEIVELTPMMRKDSIILLGKFRDHKISYCDAVSVMVMRHKKIKYMFAFDHHFELMGLDLINHSYE
ncbi:MAG TPA: PIN domain-containing protein [Bacilli bacterium]